MIKKHALIREMRVSYRNSPWVSNELKLLMELKMLTDWQTKKAANKHKSSPMDDHRKVRYRMNCINI